MKSIAIVGGGITGLTAAFRLKCAGHEVCLFEAGPRTGGVIQTVRENGYLAESGPNTLLETSPKIGELVADLGLEKRRWYSDPEAESRYILRGGEPIEMATSPPGFFASPLFSWKAKLRLMAEPFIGRAPAESEESLAEFVKRRLGQEFLDYAINPFVAGVYAGDPEHLSVKQAFPKLNEIEQRYGSLIKGQILGARERKKSGTVSKQNAKKVSFDRGLQVLTDTLTEKLGDTVRLGTPVKALNMTGEGIEVVTDSGTAVFEEVLLALPAYALAELRLEGGGECSLEALKEVQYPPVASVVLGYRREDVAHSLSGFGTLNPEVEKVNTLGTLFSSSLFPDRAPEGYVTLTSYVGGTRSPELARRTPEEIIALVRGDLEAIYGATGEPTYQYCFISPRAIPQYNVGYGRFKDLMSEVEKEMPGVYLAGHCRDGISLADSIVSGHDVADRMNLHS